MNNNQEEQKLFEWLLMNYLCWKCKCLSDDRYEKLSEIDYLLPIKKKNLNWRQHVAKEIGVPKSDWLKQNMSIKDVFSFVAECYPHNLEEITDMIKDGLRNK
jgi:hypothetical protein